MPITVVGKGKPILLLHAFGMDARQFLPFLLPMLKDHCFYLPHFRGFGLSADSPTTQFDFIEQYANDVDSLLSYICRIHKTAAIDVAAISMGALVIWAYFSRYLRHTKSREACQESHLKVKRYLNIDQSPTVHNLSDWHGGVFGNKQTEVFAQFEAILDVVLPYLHNDGLTDFAYLPYEVKREIVEMERMFSLLTVAKKSSHWLISALQHHSPRKLAFYTHSNWQQKIRCLQAYLALPYDYRANLNNLTIPVTMLIGSQSALYDPKWQHKIVTMLPNAKAIEIQNSGHAIPMDAPIAFTRALKSFLLNP